MHIYIYIHTHTKIQRSMSGYSDTGICELLRLELNQRDLSGASGSNLLS
jgi:hypothetical protein